MEVSTDMCASSRERKCNMFFIIRLTVDNRCSLDGTMYTWAKFFGSFGIHANEPMQS